MKQFVALLSYMAFIGSLFLTSCGSQPADDTVPPPPHTPETAEEMMSVYQKAAAVYDWFDLCSLPVTGEDMKVIEGNTYLKVDDDSVSTYASLENMVRAYFSPEISSNLLENSINYRDIDGKLYTLDGARGSHINLFDKSIHIRHPDDTHWTVEIRFWTDFTDETNLQTFGYSSEVLNYEEIDEGFRFTNFCSSDALDLDADTVCTFDPGEIPPPDADSWELICRMMFSDGAVTEAAAEGLLNYFIAEPELTLIALAHLADSPFRDLAGYEQIPSILCSPAVTAAQCNDALRSSFESALASCAPEGGRELELKEVLKDTYEKILQKK